MSASGAEIPCRQEDPELWFAEHPRHIERAKALCRSCPVRAECLGAAMERGEPWGVWGGELLVRGRILAHKRARGRPRKVPAPGVA
ncbi:WhiB family transcriptional regulator [Segeticoccus rhizosphaerae]|uniref:WhiB family transcriptional regulator n=1 Tax=Segeticoccus rhizosphaerae TaxID=1104777 RepID=UPI0023674957|nr:MULTISPECIES: WhiB family transcriptional regulator [Intrasporangiaceae]